jgi:ribosomal protein S6--L-glutamate ligase
MKLLLFTGNIYNYTSKRLAKVAGELNHDLTLMPFYDCHLFIKNNRADILFQNQELPYFDAVIPRVGSREVNFNIALIKHLEVMGMRCVNSSLAYQNTKDKFRSMQLLNQAQIPVPDSFLYCYDNNFEQALNFFQPHEHYVLKLPTGSQGVGVVKCDSASSLYSTVQAFNKIGMQAITQEFIPQARRDIRLFVVGGEVIASMEREAEIGEFRANAHIGGICRKVVTSDEEKKLSIAAVKALELEIAGVDLVRTDDGPLILEVNACPGFEALEEITGINVAKRILDYIVQGS